MGLEGTPNSGRQVQTAQPRRRTEGTMKHSPFSRRYAAAGVIGVVCSSLLVAFLMEFGESRLSKEHEESALRDKEAISAALHVVVQEHNNKLTEQLSELDAGTLTPLRFHSMATFHAQVWPDVTRISWLRKDFEVHATIPAAPEGQAVRSNTPLAELAVWYQSALDAREPACSSVFESDDGELGFEVIAPILHDNQPAGFFVISSSLDEFLTNYLPDGLRRDYAFTPISGSREFAAFRTSEKPLEGRFAQEIDLDSAIPGLTLRAVPFATGLGRYRTPLKVAAILLTSGLCILLWLLGWTTLARRGIEKELFLSREELRSFAAHLQSSMEEERSVMARDIHDELGSAMTVLKVGLSGLTEEVPNANHRNGAAFSKRLKALDEVIDGTLQWGRRFASSLRPQILDDFGIVSALEWQAEEFRKRMGIRCLTDISLDDIHLDKELSTAVFRICQEALTNVARHAQATRVCISLDIGHETLKLIVHDNGKGITKKAKANLVSRGLVGMRERANAVGGDLQVSSEPGEGTVVALRIPGITAGETEVLAKLAG
jgi:signal transduction histidine kinase